MRKVSILLVAALATAVPSLTVAGPAHAKPGKPKAELVTTGVSATLAGSALSTTATVKNKGHRKAKASRTAFRLSTDTIASGDDLLLGAVPLGRLRPKQSKKATGTFTLPATVAVGSYHVVACADSALVVKERKETNNCRVSTVTVDVGAGGTVTVSATAGVGGTVNASAVTGGTCAATTCSFGFGKGTVTFTPAAATGYRFGGWSGATCTGYAAGAGNAITFTNPTSAKACSAGFVRQVTISWAVSPVQLTLVGSVSGAASNGACTSDPLTGGGSCLVDAGVGTVTLTPTAILPTFHFTGWTGSSCTSASNPLALTAPAADVACTANFGIL